MRFLARKVGFKIMISLWLSWHTGGWTAPGRVGQRSLRCHFVGRPLQRRRKLTTDPRGAVVVRMQRHADRCFAFWHRSLSEFSRPSMERSKRRIWNSKESFYKVPGNCYATRLARLDQTLSPQLVYQSWCLFARHVPVCPICCCPIWIICDWQIGIDLAWPKQYDAILLCSRDGTAWFPGRYSAIPQMPRIALSQVQEASWYTPLAPSTVRTHT